MATIGQQFDDAQAALARDTEGKIARTREALAEARKKLDDALAAAREKREQTEQPDAPNAARPENVLAQLEERLAGVGEAVAQKIDVVGSFNVAALAGLTGNAEERTAKNTEQIAYNTKRLAEAAITQRLVFS